MIPQFIEKSPYHALLFGVEPAPTLSKNQLEKLAKELLKKRNAKAPSWELVAKTIIGIAANKFEVNPQLVTKRSRKQPYPRVRMVCYYILRQHCKTPLMKIGKYFNRDHSTVMFALESYEFLRINDRELRQKFIAIEKEFAARYAELCVA